LFYKVNSILAQLEQLKCDICYHVIRLVKQNKGGMNYKSTNGISMTLKHLENACWEIWNEWIN
jgi:hypothetical protein